MQGPAGGWTPPPERLPGRATARPKDIELSGRISARPDAPTRALTEWTYNASPPSFAGSATRSITTIRPPAIVKPRRPGHAAGPDSQAGAWRPATCRRLPPLRRTARRTRRGARTRGARPARASRSDGSIGWFVRVVWSQIVVPGLAATELAPIRAVFVSLSRLMTGRAWNRCWPVTLSPAMDI